MIKTTSFILLLISFISVCQGLYFHIAETERKCFIEEIPDETTVIGIYYIILKFTQLKRSKMQSSNTN